MVSTTTSAAEIARQVKAAVDQLNGLVLAARTAGLLVRLNVGLADNTVVSVSVLQPL